MRYAQVVPFDVCNGKGIGISLFVQGCNLHCKNCFNSDTWDFDGGKEWNEQTKQKFFDLLSRYYIKRVSFLGGEPLAYGNTEEVLSLINRIRDEYPDKKIWLFTGYTWDTIMYPAVTDIFDPERDAWLSQRIEIIRKCDVVVDGRFIDELKDITLPFRGSSNQRIIDVQKSLEQNAIVSYYK